MLKTFGSPLLVSNHVQNVGSPLQKHIRQFGHAWPSLPHQKQMSAVMSFGCGGANTLKAGGAALEGPEMLAMGGRNCETVVGSVATHGRGHQSMPPAFESVCTGEAICNEV
jgi:hypothetical protein